MIKGKTEVDTKVKEKFESNKGKKTIYKGGHL